MDDLAINDIRFVSVQHFKNRMKDTFTVCIDAEASDYTVDTTNNIVSSNRRFKLLKKDDTEKSLEKFQEFWTFARKDESHWVLAAVDSSTAWKKSIARALVNEDGAA